MAETCKSCVDALGGPGIKTQMKAAIRASHNGTVLIADDCTRKWADVPAAWQRLSSLFRMRPLEWDVLPSPSYTYRLQPAAAMQAISLMRGVLLRGQHGAGARVSRARP